MDSCLDCFKMRKYWPDGDMDDPCFSGFCEANGKDIGYGNRREDFLIPPDCPKNKGEFSK